MNIFLFLCAPIYLVHLCSQHGKFVILKENRSALIQGAAWGIFIGLCLVILVFNLPVPIEVIAVYFYAFFLYLILPSVGVVLPLLFLYRKYRSKIFLSSYTTCFFVFFHIAIYIAHFDYLNQFHLIYLPLLYLSTISIITNIPKTLFWYLIPFCIVLMVFPIVLSFQLMVMDVLAGVFVAGICLFMLFYPTIFQKFGGRIV